VTFVPSRLLALVGALCIVFAGSRGDPARASSVYRAGVQRGVLPEWARGGFSEPRPRVAHDIGHHGQIAAILFGDPLTAPARAGRSNKILWVSRARDEAGTDLRISAHRIRGRRAVGPRVLRVVRGGPGPSIINLPRAGCWRLSLRWGHHADTIDLRYARRRS